jgi:hypothetical protein
MTQNELLSEMVLEDSSSLRCVSCDVEEYVFPLDDKCIDAGFVANYLCHDCEEVVINMQAAAQSRHFSIVSATAKIVEGKPDEVD